jgi:hypothetical protein
MHIARSWSAFVEHARRAVVVALTLGAAACPAFSSGGGAGGLVGSGGLVDTTEIGRQIDRTITNISTDTTRWSAELDGLARYLVDQKFTEAATFVRDSLEDGIARVGVEFRCNVDFTVRRVRQGLEALKEAILSLGGDTTSTTTFPPFVCTATPPDIKWVEAPQAISLAGYDFHPTGITVTVIGRAGQTTDITAALTQPSPYQLILNLTGAGATFPRDCARVELRAQGSLISTLACLTDCPPGEPPTIIPAESRIVWDETRTCGDSVLTGCTFNSDVGGTCPTGYFRVTPIEVTKVDGNGSGNCGEGDQNAADPHVTHWQSANPADCSIHEHIGLAGGTFHGFWTCRYIVTALKPEQVINHPPPQVGWCH